MIAIIQARMGSERFPGKILAPLAGQPLLKVLVERIRPAAGLDAILLATTEDPADNLTAEWGRALGLNVFRGSTDDVLSRFTSIIRQENPDWVFRLTADTPEDYAMAKAAFALFGEKWATGRYSEMVSCLDRHSDITASNASIQQKSLEEGSERLGRGIGHLRCGYRICVSLDMGFGYDCSFTRFFSSDILRLLTKSAKSFILLP